MVVACCTQWVIGRDGQMPWRLSADLQRFKKLTMGHPIIMGRKTFESIGRLLPGRTTIILTRGDDFHHEGAIVVHDETGALIACQDSEEAFVVGGAEIYKLFLPKADRIYLTKVHTMIPDGDTFFPRMDFSNWNLTDSEEVSADLKNEFATRFEIWDRIAENSR